MRGRMAFDGYVRNMKWLIRLKPGIQQGIEDMSIIQRSIPLRFSIAAMLIFLALFVEVTVTCAQKACTDNEIWSVFPSSKELGDVNDQLLMKSGPTVNTDGTRTFSMRWSGGTTSRSVSVTITEYTEPKWASKKVHEYGLITKKDRLRLAW